MLKFERHALTGEVLEFYSYKSLEALETFGAKAQLTPSNDTLPAWALDTYQTQLPDLVLKFERLALTGEVPEFYTYKSLEALETFGAKAQPTPSSDTLPA